jgi:protein O-GlcNAc transferase
MLKHCELLREMVNMEPAKNQAEQPNKPSPAEISALIALYNAQRYAEVESLAYQLTGQYPGTVLLWKLLGGALQAEGKDAVSALLTAVKLSPNDAELFNSLGSALQQQGKLEEARQCYRRAVEIKPDFAAGYYNLGNVLCAMGNLEGAVIRYRNALAVNPFFVEVHSNLGATLQELGWHDEAIASCRRALELKPDLPALHSNLLGMLNSTSGHSPAYCLAEAREYGRRISKQVTARFSSWQCVDHPERLRVGIVSGNLHYHPVGFFLESMLAQIDSKRIELFAYPTDTHVDALTLRIQPYFAAWKPIYDLSDALAAQLIHADGIHVLLDLSGHCEQNRLPLFAWKPAPVQASWLDYFATTGVTEMDYLLADEVGVPESQRGNFSETIWYLPDTRLCFTPPTTDLPVAALPALKNGHLTFGCFQNLAKINDAVLNTWGTILTALPTAKLRWQCKQLGDPAIATHLTQRLQQHGISPARISLHATASREKYLAAHAEVDVILDTFPYPGGTTTCEALWMGVPTLTLAGDSLLARQGASLLTAAGLEEWVAYRVTDYIDQAVTLTRDLDQLSVLRDGLREQVNLSPLFDAKRFARHFEAALWGMWVAHTQHRSSTPTREPTT